MSTRHRLGAIIGAGVVAASLAACGGGTPGAAVVVDGRSISEHDVQTAYEQVGPLFNGQLAVGQLAALLGQEPAFTEVGQEFGIAFTDQQLTDLYTSTADQLGLDSDVDLTDSSLAMLRLSAVSTGLNQLSPQQVQQAGSELDQKLADLDVRVSPRYAVDEDSGLPGSYPWLVQTDAATATP